MDEAISKEPVPPAHLKAYSFELGDEEAWVSHLRDRGFVVLRGVADGSEVEAALSAFWAEFERRYGAVRGDTSSWNDWRGASHGLSATLCHCEGAWRVRCLPRLRSAFESLWGRLDAKQLVPSERPLPMLVSMDSVIVWKPWWIEERWRPFTEGLHLDQNPFDKPDFDCVQGMVPLLPVTEATGGLQVLPESHLEAARRELAATHLHFKGRGDWCELGDGFRMATAGAPELLLAEPGDLILWDSRTIHGGLVGTGEVEASRPGVLVELARLSVPVAMTPKAWASEEVQRSRLKAFEQGESLNHCPHEAGTSSGTIRARHGPGYRPVQLTFEEAHLIPIKDGLAAIKEEFAAP